MRRWLTAGALLTSVVLAGCAVNAKNGPQPPQAESKSGRTSPAKSVELADKCSVIKEQQSRELGTDQAPYPRELNGHKGCWYQKGQAGTPGWAYLVAVENNSTFADQVKNANSEPAKTGSINGYPAADFVSPIGCIVLVDVSDKGYLILNGGKNGAADPGIDLCQQGEKFAEAALQNLPNA